MDDGTVDARACGIPRDVLQLRGRDPKLISKILLRMRRANTINNPNTCVTSKYSSLKQKSPRTCLRAGNTQTNEATIWNWRIIVIGNMHEI